MIQKPDTKKSPRFFYLSSQLFVFTAGARVSAGMVVDQDNMNCVIAQRLNKHLSGRGNRHIDGSPENQRILNQYIFRIQHH